MPLLSYFLLFITILLSGSSLFVFKTNRNKDIKTNVVFSGAYLFALTVLHLIPEVYTAGKGSGWIYFARIFHSNITGNIFRRNRTRAYSYSQKQNAAFPPWNDDWFVLT